MTVQRLYSRARRLYRHSGASCLARGRHDPRRTMLGTFRCRECRRSVGDYEELGLSGGHVNTLRTLFDRDRRSITRTTAFEPTKRGF